MQNESNDIDASKTLIKAVAGYIASGRECDGEECIGIELEHFIVRKKDKGYVPYLNDPKTGRPGIKSILERLSPFYDEAVFEASPDGGSNLIGLSRKHAAISLEPGAQFEISIGPVLGINDLALIYQTFRSELDPILDEMGYEVIGMGYHPSILARDVPLIPKDRYRFMDEYFKKTGHHGICMMRATASTQVSLDFNSELDAIRKFRIANALCPLLAFITDNSPLFELEPVGCEMLSTSFLEVPKRMARTVVWDDVDALRSMTAPHTFEAGFNFESYAHTLLNTPAILTTERDETGRLVNTRQNDRTFGEIYEGRELDHSTIEHILSMYFFDVRFKTYIEIRAADSLPIKYALSYAAFLKGLFYDRDTVEALSARFDGLSSEDIAAAKLALRSHSFEAQVYGRNAADWLDELLALSSASLPPGERNYLADIGQLITSRKTLVDLAAKNASKRSGGLLSSLFDLIDFIASFG